MVNITWSLETQVSTISHHLISEHQPQLLHQANSQSDPIILSMLSGQPWRPVTPVNPHHLKLLLDGYDPDKTDYLVNGFMRGFSICSKNDFACQANRNSRFVEDHADILAPFVQAEVDAGRYVGPFDEIPLDRMYISPLGARPKKQPGSYRLIHDLSYPYDGVQSVNDGIDAASSSVQYYSVADAIDILLSLAPGAYMCKSDIAKAFRIIPIRQEDHHLLGFSFQGKFYFDTCLSMGCSASCRIFEEFSTPCFTHGRRFLHSRSESGVSTIISRYFL